MISTHPRKYTHNGRWIPAGLLTLLGLSLGTFILQFLITHPGPPVWWRVELLVSGSIVAMVIYSGYWLVETDYNTRDLWVIFGWSIVGVAVSIMLAGGLYVHQTAAGVSLADPAFLFEFLALIGAGLGIIFGITRQSRSEQPSKSNGNTAMGVDSDTLWGVLSLLDGDIERLHQRWIVVKSLVRISTHEIPLNAFMVQLTKKEAFPDDERIVERLVFSEHIPVLEQKGLIKIDEEIETIRYVGPEWVAEYLSNL